MCRILATCGDWESDAISEALKKFGALAESGVVPTGDAPGHKDGWGLAAYDSKKVAFFEKRPASAVGDPEFENAVKQIVALNPSVIVGHLRKASVGSIKLENTHPFVIGNWTFCHNGSIGVKGDMAGLHLDTEYVKKRKGETDSETFFLYLLQLLGGANDPAPATIQKAISDTINLIRTTRDYTALNCILTNGRVLIVVREANEKNEWVKKENLCDNYYTLFIGKSADQKKKIICSEKLSLDGILWTEISNHTIEVVPV